MVFIGGECFAGMENANAGMSKDIWPRECSASLYRWERWEWLLHAGWDMVGLLGCGSDFSSNTVQRWNYEASSCPVGVCIRKSENKANDGSLFTGSFMKVILASNRHGSDVSAIAKSQRTKLRTTWTVSNECSRLRQRIACASWGKDGVSSTVKTACVTQESLFVRGTGIPLISTGQIKRWIWQGRIGLH